jgi:hypothetical protein
MDMAIMRCAVLTPFMNNAFMNMNQARRHAIVIEVSARDRLARRICKGYN